MGIFQAAEDRIKAWAFGAEAQNAALIVGKAAASYGLAHAGVLSQWGISASIDPNLIAAGLLAGLHMIVSWAATKWPDKLGWLAHS